MGLQILPQFLRIKQPLEFGQNEFLRSALHLGSWSIFLTTQKQFKMNHVSTLTILRSVIFRKNVLLILILKKYLL